MAATGTGNRFDTTLRVLMWLDAFWSVAFVLAALLAVPVAAIAHVPGAVRLAHRAAVAVARTMRPDFEPAERDEPPRTPD